MTRLVLTRVAGGLGVLFAQIALIFLLQQISGTDPAKTLVGSRATPEALAAAREQLGLDDSFPARLVRYTVAVLHGEFGLSVSTRRSVQQDIVQFLPATLELVVASLVIAGFLGLVFAMASSARWIAAPLFRGAVMLFAAFPVFFIAALSIRIFAGDLQVLPPGGRSDDPTQTGFVALHALVSFSPDQLNSAFSHLILPAICLALVPAVAIGRMLRSGIEEQLQRDHVRTACSFGLTEGQVVLRHTLRNAAGPTLSLTGINVAYLLGTSVVVEQIFAWPGIGQYMAQAIKLSDFNAVAGASLVLGAIFVLVNLTVDLLQIWAEPRLRMTRT